MALVNAPNEPSIKNNQINFPGGGSPSLATKNVTVSGVHAFSGANSGFTYSALTLPYPAASNCQVLVNGLTMKQSKNNGATFQEGDYYISGIRIIFAPRTVKNGDIAQVIYPTQTNRSYYKQVLTVGTIGTNTESEIYKDSANYYINLDYEVLGAVSFALNGQILTENVDFRKVTSSRIQLLTYTVGGSPDLAVADVITMYYLTQYYVSGLATSSSPEVIVQFNKKLGLKESLRLVVYDGNGDIVQEDYDIRKPYEGGTVNTQFRLKVPSPGTYRYRVELKRTYPLINGKEITTERQTKEIEFTMDSTTFYSPYDKPRTDSGVLGGTY